MLQLLRDDITNLGADFNGFDVQHPIRIVSVDLMHGSSVLLTLSRSFQRRLERDSFVDEDASAVVVVGIAPGTLQIHGGAVLAVIVGDVPQSVVTIHSQDLYQTGQIRLVDVDAVVGAAHFSPVKQRAIVISVS